MTHFLYKPQYLLLPGYLKLTLVTTIETETVLIGLMLRLDFGSSRTG